MERLDLFLVKLTLKEKTLPYTPETFWISDRSFVAGELYSGSPDVYAGLADLGGFAQTMGEVMPATSSGQITLNNHRGSLGHDRRFSDLIQKYAFYWQEVQVYYFPKPVNSIGDVNNLASEFKGRITNIKLDNTSQLFQISVTSDEISSESPNFIIEESVYPNAPEGLFGEALPIVFGEDIQVPCVRLTKEGGSGASAQFGYASTFGSTFVNGGIKKLYVKADKDSYIPFTPVASTSTPILEFAPNSNAVNDIWELFDQEEVGIQLKPGQNAIAGQVVAGASWYLHFNGATYNGTDAGIFGCKVYNSENGFPLRQISGGAIELPDNVSQITNIGTIGSAVNVYRFDFTLEEPIVIPRTEPIFITFSHNIGYWDSDLEQYVDTAIAFPVRNDPSGVAWERYLKLTGQNQFIRSVRPAEGTRDLFTIWGVALTDNPTPSTTNIKGIGASTFTVSRRAQSSPDLASLEFVADIDGLKDSSSGTITGTNNQLITLPQDSLKLLYYKQNNDSLTDWGYVISESNINSSFFPSIIKGASRGINSYRDLMKDILIAFSGKIYPAKNGGYRLWAYGSVVQVDYEVDDSDCTINEIVYQGKGNIINSVTVKYDRRAIPLSLQDSQRKDSERDNYARTRIYEEGASFNSANVLSGSTLLYGREELQSEVRQIDWFTSDAIASRLARYILSTYGTESAILSISLPLIKNNFFNIRIGDILRINHPDLPSFFGSGTNTEQLPTLGGRVLDNFNLGYPWRRGEQITVRVIARSPQLEITQQGEPQLNLIVREITKYEAKRPEVN